MPAEIEAREEQSKDQCTVCKNTRWVFAREGYDLYRPNGKVFRLDQCLSCGHVMQNPSPGGEELSKAYSIEYAPYRPAWKETNWSLWRVLRELTTLRRIRRLKRYAKGSRLLEVGSGAGDFLYAAHREGWQVAAVEYSEPLVNEIRSELAFDVQAGELRPGLWKPESFDLLVLWSVIEHVPDPLETLITAGSYLKPGGTLFFQLPTVYGVWQGGFFRQYWAILDLPRHLNFFGRKSLSDLCEKAGLRLTVFKTPLLDVAWCYFASCSNYANAAKSKAQKLLRLALFPPIMVLAMPFMLARAWRRRGTEAFAVAVKR